MRATLDALSCPVGKVTIMEGLFTAWPALTFAFKLCRKEYSLFEHSNWVGQVLR